MPETLLLGLVSIIVLGISAQYIAWRFRLPAILLLLIFGFIAGPVTNFVDPNAILGAMLLPFVSVSVALILFEGGMSLNLTELRTIGRVLRNLISIGAIVTIILSSLAAYLFLGFNLPLAILLGSVLVVTGPTVIIPLMRHVRPIGRSGSILKWEGILIDPIGAMLAALVFQAIITGGFQSATLVAFKGLLKTIFIGLGIGTIGAATIVIMLKRYWIPDFLHNAISIMVVITTHTASNMLQTESGLLAVTIMGILLANQKFVNVKHIIKFEENIRVLLISSLFIILSARLQVTDIARIEITGILFIIVLIFMIRPIAVLVSSLGSNLSWKEQLFLSSVAPRGIIAAAVASIFALRLEEIGYPQTEYLVPVTFLVIVGTVAFYGLTAAPLARELKLSQPNPQGILFVGAHPWVRMMAKSLKNEGVPVLMIDTNWWNISAARLEGLPTYYASILSERVQTELDLSGIGRLLAMTSNDEVNSLAALDFIDSFGRSEVYQLPPHGHEEMRTKKLPHHLRGRLLFNKQISYPYLHELFDQGAVIKKTTFSQTYTYKLFQSQLDKKVTPLFLITEKKDLLVYTTESQPTPRAGQTLISIVSNNGEQKQNTSNSSSLPPGTVA